MVNQEMLCRIICFTESFVLYDFKAIEKGTLFFFYQMEIFLLGRHQYCVKMCDMCVVVVGVCE